MSVAGCDFCAIANGSSDADLLFEAPLWFALVPLEPATPGHTLIVPRKHVNDMWSVDSGLGLELWYACVMVGRALREVIHPRGMNLVTSSGIAAEQTVFHLHLHLLPRYPDDEVDLWPPSAALERSLSEAERAAIKVRVESGYREL